MLPRKGLKSISNFQINKVGSNNLKSLKGVFASDLIDRCVEKWFAEQEKFDIEGQEYYKNRGNNYTQMMWKASKKCEYQNVKLIDDHFLNAMALNYKSLHRIR